MSKYGGSERKKTKTTQAIVAAYNKPRLSTRSTQSRGTRWRPISARPRGRTNRHHPPTKTTPTLGWGHRGGRSLLDAGGPSSSQSWQRLFSATCCPDKLRSPCPLTPIFPTHEQLSVFFFRCVRRRPASSAPSGIFPAFSQPKIGDRVRLEGWYKVLTT